MTKTIVPTLDELERHETADLLKRCPAHRRLLAKLRDERAFDAELVRERAILDAAIAEHQRLASVERVELPVDGTDDDALLLALRGLGDSKALAVEQSDGHTVEFHTAHALAFVPSEKWPRIREQVLAALRRAHPQRPERPWTYVLVEPGEPRDDLCTLIGKQHALAMPRETLLQNLALALPACSIAARWFRAASESRDPAASAVAHAIFASFTRAGRVDELAASQAAK